MSCKKNLILNMKKIIFLLFLIPLSTFGQNEKEINLPARHTVDFQYPSLTDGPYVFIKEDHFLKKSIKNGVVFSEKLGQDTFNTEYSPKPSTFNNVNKIVALSDIHGQYDLLIKLLINNKIIDEDLFWIFGKGHFVVVGDIFDRGDKVNEVLWFLYDLEIQAKKKGGFVHILLGNHEYMVFQNDLRYIHSKYHKTPFLLGIEYKELYGKNTVIGKWLRSKPTIIKINDIMFTHAGISREFFSSVNFDLDKINRDMRESIDLSIDEMVSNNFYNIYFGEKSLTWYRGYYYHDMTDKQLNKLLDKIDAKHIVVGHSSSDNVLELYDNIVYCVDSSMKLGEYGEILLIKNNVFYRGTLSGKLIKL